MIPTDIQPSVLAILYALRSANDERREWVRRHLSGMHWVGGSDPFSYEMAFDFALERGLVEVRTVKRHRIGERWNGQGQRAWTAELLYATRAGHKLFLSSERRFFNADSALGWRAALARRPRSPTWATRRWANNDWLYGYDCFLLTRPYRLDAANF